MGHFGQKAFRTEESGFYVPKGKFPGLSVKDGRGSCRKMLQNRMTDGSNLPKLFWKKSTEKKTSWTQNAL